MYYSSLKELSEKDTATNTSSQQEEEHLQEGKNLQGQKSLQEHERKQEQNQNDFRLYKYRDPPKFRRKTDPLDEDIDNFKKLKNIRRCSAPINEMNYINRPSKMDILSDDDYRIDEEPLTSSHPSSFDRYNITSPCNPPSLSPSSSTSSLNSCIDHLNNSFVFQQNNNNNYYDSNTNNNKNHHYNSNDKMSINNRTTTDIDHFRNEGESFSSLNKESTPNPYENCSSYLSPAALFLTNLAFTGAESTLPDDEGQKVGEYVLGKIIADGGFSFVRECYTVDKMERAAVKIVRKNDKNEDNIRIQTLLKREISIWSTLNHPNIVRIISVKSMDFATFMFSEYCPGGTLLQYLRKRCRNSDNRRDNVYGKKRNIGVSGNSSQRKRNSMVFSFDTYEGVEKKIIKGLREDEARNIFLEIASAVRYLHEDMKLVHKDIKLDNILLDRNHHWKLCDFGLTEFQDSDANEFSDIVVDEIVRGSLPYCSPEQLKSKKSLKTSAIDIWSLGVVLFALVTAQLPFADNFEPRLQFKILRGKYDESLLRDADVSDELHDLLKGMFKTNPDERLTITQILDHSWCDGNT